MRHDLAALLADPAGVDTVPAEQVPALLAHAARFSGPSTVGLFHKGRGWRAELTSAREAWNMQVRCEPSVVEPEGDMVEARSKPAVKHAGHHVRRLLERYRKATGVAEQQHVGDGAVERVVELAEEPAPRRLSPLEIRDPEGQMVQHRGERNGRGSLGYGQRARNPGH